MAGLQGIEKLGARVEPAGRYSEIKIPIDDVTVTAFVSIETGTEGRSGSEIHIHSFDTDPATERGKGYGTVVAKQLFSWAKQNGFSRVRAVGVEPQSITFWTKLGFAKIKISDQHDYELILK